MLLDVFVILVLLSRLVIGLHLCCNVESLCKRTFSKVYFNVFIIEILVGCVINKFFKSTKKESLSLHQLMLLFEPEADMLGFSNTQKCFGSSAVFAFIQEINLQMAYCKRFLHIKLGLRLSWPVTCITPQSCVYLPSTSTFYSPTTFFVYCFAIKIQPTKVAKKLNSQENNCQSLTQIK